MGGAPWPTTETPAAERAAGHLLLRRAHDARGRRGAQREERRSTARWAGPERVQRQHVQNKLTVRERLDLLFDPGTFVEHGLLAHHQSQSPAMQGKFTPADGVVTGIGEVDGRKVAVIAYDFTVMAGSMGMVTELKATRMRELALRERIPLVWLIDSAGARIQEATGSMFARTGDLFREQVIMSGVVPQVAAMMGPGAAGTAYIPGLADFVPMVKGTSNMALAGPHLVKAAVGEDVTAEDMGGSKVHYKISGVADLEVEDDEECIEAVRKYLVLLPVLQPRDSRRWPRRQRPDRPSVRGALRHRAGQPSPGLRRPQGDRGDRRRRRLLPDEAGLGAQRRDRVRALRRAPGWDRREPAEVPRRRARRERAPTRPRASCGCATRSTSRWCS